MLRSSAGPRGGAAAHRRRAGELAAHRGRGSCVEVLRRHGDAGVHAGRDRHRRRTSAARRARLRAVLRLVRRVRAEGPRPAAGVRDAQAAQRQVRRPMRGRDGRRVPVPGRRSAQPPPAVGDRRRRDRQRHVGLEGPGDRPRVRARRQDQRHGVRGHHRPDHARATSANCRRRAPTGGIFWRDIKVYKDHAFVVSENTNHGMQVFDLTRLRNVRRARRSRSTPTPSTAGSAAHAQPRHQRGLRLRVPGRHQHLHSGTSTAACTWSTSATRATPTFAGCALVPPGSPNNNYVHDSQCVNYAGPDRRYAGREICFGVQRGRRRDLRRHRQGQPGRALADDLPDCGLHPPGLADRATASGSSSTTRATRRASARRRPSPVQTTYILNVEDLVRTSDGQAEPEQHHLDRPQPLHARQRLRLRVQLHVGPAHLHRALGAHR